MNRDESISLAIKTLNDFHEHKKTFRVEGCYSGHNYGDEPINDFENKASDLILNATEEQIKEAYDVCEDYGCENITPEEIFREIGEKADSPYDNIGINRVNIWEV